MRRLKMASLKGKKKTFILELKERYREMYSSIRPVPSIRQRTYYINDICIESGIEYLLITRRGKGRWTPLGHFKDIFKGNKNRSTRKILEGQPGYGKSLVALKLTHGWCNQEDDSPIRDVEILIHLRLRDLGGVSSIYRGIKWFLLPEETRLTEKDIENILQSSSSVLILLDGHDEYPDRDSPSENDVKRLMRSQLLPEADVTLTTRYVPSEFAPTANRLKMTGFDKEARDLYICEVVAKGNGAIAKRIKGVLEENPVLGDMCKVPLFLAMMAHSIYDHQSFESVNTVTVTNSARQLVCCFIDHARNKASDDRRPFQLIEDTDRKLGREALLGLSNQCTEWRRENLREKVGAELYDQYVMIGFLVEVNDHSSSEAIRVVRFFNDVFLQWFAADYISDALSQEGGMLYTIYDEVEDEKSDCLEQMDPLDVQCLYFFVSGMSPAAAQILQDYMKSLDNCEEFSILCMLEQEEQVNSAKEAIAQACASDMHISRYDEKSVQAVIIKILELACKYGIPIEFLVLNECYRWISPGGDEIHTMCGLTFNPFSTVQQIWFEKREKQYTLEEFDRILMYAVKCPNLKALKFVHSVLPASTGAHKARLALAKRGVTLDQWPRSAIWYHFNFEGNFWEYTQDHTKVTPEKYQYEVDNYRSFYYLD